ncbi:MoaD/ThiS family protein [Thermococci archaeon]|nr:MAG: MoaD/ThiS family protein [Thermococci archaeon]
MKVKIRLYGELALKHRAEIELKVRDGATIGEILKNMGISDAEHHLLVNEKRVSKEYQVKDGDYLKLLPIVYGGCSS